jgi:hypothetical protein
MGGAVGATNISIRRWSGGLTFNNIAAGDVISIDVISGGTITLNGADGNVQVRGMCNVVDNRTGTPTLGTTNNMDARFDAVDSQLTAIVGDTSELQTDWTNGGRLDLLIDTLVTNVGIILNSVVVFNGLVQDASPTASGFDTNLTQADDWWVDKVVLFIDGNLQYQSRVCSAYINASGAMTFDEPFTAAPTNGSNFYILAIHAHTITQIQSGLATAASVNDLPTNVELAAAITTGLTTALVEGYRSTNATGSVRDLLYEILQSISEFTISGTTKTVKKLEGSTTAKTYTLNDGTTPTGITEAT